MENIVKTTIQKDNRGEQRVVYEDETGTEWTVAIQGKDSHGRITKLVKKSEDHFFKDGLEE